jgi:lysozyme
MANNYKKIVGGVAIAGAALLAFVGGNEGREHVPYLDIVGVPTYCDGITSPPPVPGKVYTDAECNSLLEANVAKHGEAFLQCVTVKINQNEYDAFASWAFNVGTGAACKSNLVRRLNAGDHIGACDELMRWNRAGGKEVRGLTNRRKKERDLCIKPMPAPITERAIA